MFDLTLYTPSKYQDMLSYMFLHYHQLLSCTYIFKKQVSSLVLGLVHRIGRQQNKLKKKYFFMFRVAVIESVIIE